MVLSRYTLKNINADTVVVPDESLFELPEKVLQFGMNELLRGLPCYFIDKANRNGIFNGRIVAVSLNPNEDLTYFDRQDGLYTHCICDVKSGERFEQTIINSSISRVLNGAEQWNEILDCAHSIDIQVIISNTTEVGIQLVPEDIRHHAPKSYPGKLLSFLYERFKAFEGSAHSGMVIVPTELVSNNGKKLESIVLELAHLNGLEEEFIEWMENHNYFCSSLVDRIITAKQGNAFLNPIEIKLGYVDNLLITSEDYALWSIEGNDHVKEILAFEQADHRVMVKPDIDLHRELKLRLLNGTHTLSCGVAFLSGIGTVKEAMEDKTVSSYITNLMTNEIANAIPYEVESSVVHDFASAVFHRFCNPYLMHTWVSIAQHYTAKMKFRCVPILVKHYENSDSVPQAIALGFASYISFMKSVVKNNEEYYVQLNGEGYLIEDKQAEVYLKLWKDLGTSSAVHLVLSDSFWGVDLLSLPGFKQSVIEKLNLIMNNGMKEAIENIPSKKVKAA